jgi:hypothetical protein
MKITRGRVVCRSPKRIVKGGAIKARHAQITENDAVLILVEQLQGFDPVPGSIYHAISLTQHGQDDLSQTVVIINDEDAVHTRIGPRDGAKQSTPGCGHFSSFLHTSHISPPSRSKHSGQLGSVTCA